MPSDLLDTSSPVVFGLSADELGQVLDGLGWPRFRAGQIMDWVYVKLLADPALMTNLSRLDRVKLAGALRMAEYSMARRQDSADGTIKLLLNWPDGSAAETVMIPDADRRTACVSTQTGCAVGCRFCASGAGGFSGNLSAGQIVEQVFALNVALAGAGDKSRINHVVFMGMGEPMANYAAVVKAARILHEPAGFNIGYRKITISTVGVPKRMRDLAGEGIPVNLAISLHAPTDALRRTLIPWAEHFSIAEILKAARYYFDQTGREVTIEYILLAQVNDRVEHARELAKLCKSVRANVNLIRYNEVAGLKFAAPAGPDVVRFQKTLRDAGVNAHIRKSRGADIAAACGQLRGVGTGK